MVKKAPNPKQDKLCLSCGLAHRPSVKPGGVGGTDRPTRTSEHVNTEVVRTNEDRTGMQTLL